MSVTYLNQPRKSKQYVAGMNHAIEMALDHLYEIEDSPYVYKNTHKGIKHCIEILEMLEGYYKEQGKLGWPDFYEDI
jgi:hypothetical protein